MQEWGHGGDRGWIHRRTLAHPFCWNILSIYNSKQGLIERLRCNVLIGGFLGVGVIGKQNEVSSRKVCWRSRSLIWRKSWDSDCIVMGLRCFVDEKG